MTSGQNQQIQARQPARPSKSTRRTYECIKTGQKRRRKKNPDTIPFPAHGAPGALSGWNVRSELRQKDATLRSGIDMIGAFASFPIFSRIWTPRRDGFRRYYGGFEACRFIFERRPGLWTISSNGCGQRGRKGIFVVLHKRVFAHNNEYSSSRAGWFIL